jgi:hypothetical protein
MKIPSSKMTARLKSAAQYSGLAAELLPKSESILASLNFSTPTAYRTASELLYD